MRTAKVILFMLALIYLPVAFIAWDINPANWSVYCRSLSVVFALVGFTWLVLVAYAKVREKEVEAFMKKRAKRKSGYEKILNDHLFTTNKGSSSADKQGHE